MSIPMQVLLRKITMMKLLFSPLGAMHNSSQLLTLHPCNFHWFNDLMAQMCVVPLDTDCLSRGSAEKELVFAGPATIHCVEELSIAWMVYRNFSSNRKVLLSVACISCPPPSWQVELCFEVTMKQKSFWAFHAALHPGTTKQAKLKVAP